MCRFWWRVISVLMTLIAIGYIYYQVRASQVLYGRSCVWYKVGTLQHQHLRKQGFTLQKLGAGEKDELLYAVSNEDGAAGILTSSSFLKEGLEVCLLYKTKQGTFSYRKGTLTR